MLNYQQFKHTFYKKIFGKRAKRFNALNENDLEKIVDIIIKGGIVAFPFNGIYGLFGDIDNKQAAQKILEAKNRPKDKNLIIVSEPEEIEDFVDLSKIKVNKQKLVELWKELHALGVILPASTTAPYHLVLKGDSVDTILPIWTEYKPLRSILSSFRKKGGRALVGTSANKSGQPTHFLAKTLWADFAKDVDAIAEASFDHLDEKRYKSTTVIDLSEGKPRLHRLGNVEEIELEAALKKSGFPKLIKERDIIVVQPKS